MKLKQNSYQWIVSYAGFLLQKGYVTYCACPDQATRAMIRKQAEEEY